MKKMFIVGIIFLLFGVITVKAEGYQIGTLLPVNQHASLTTNNFEYRDFYYNDNDMEAQYLGNNFVIFTAIKNVSSDARPVSISIGLFDKDSINIGTVNYCSEADQNSVVAGTILKSGEEKAYVVEVNKRHLADGKNVTDIEYISVLSDNQTCKTGATLESAGKTIEEIQKGEKNKKSIFTDSSVLCLLGVFGVVIVLVIIYKVIHLGDNRSNYNRGFSKNGVIGAGKRPVSASTSQQQKNSFMPPTSSTIEETPTSLSNVGVNDLQESVSSTPQPSDTPPVVAPKPEDKKNDLFDMYH